MFFRKKKTIYDLLAEEELRRKKFSSNSEEIKNTIHFMIDINNLPLCIESIKKYLNDYTPRSQINAVIIQMIKDGYLKSIGQIQFEDRITHGYIINN